MSETTPPVEPSRFKYPKRCSFFANKFCRVLANSGEANDLGGGTCWLLTVIANVEDARGYRSPPNFFNQQLCEATGLGSADSLARARNKAIAAGWLAYCPGGKGKAGQYFVTIPERFQWADNPTDEPIYRKNADENKSDRGFTTAKMRTQPRDNREGSAEHPSCLPAPPNPKDKIPASAGAKAKPKSPRPRDPLFDAIANVTGLDPTTAGSAIGSVAAVLLKADPPYSPDDVQRFGREFHTHCWWAKRDGRTRPEPFELQKNIGKIRSSNAPSDHSGRKSFAFGSLTKGQREMSQLLEDSEIVRQTELELQRNRNGQTANGQQQFRTAEPLAISTG